GRGAKGVGKGTLRHQWNESTATSEFRRRQRTDSTNAATSPSPLGKLCTRSRPSRMARGRGKRRGVSKLAFAPAHGSQDFETPLHFPKDSPAALHFGSGETWCRASLAPQTAPVGHGLRPAGAIGDACVSCLRD